MERICILLSLAPIFTSCAFLASPLGEELAVDAAEEVVKIENQVAHPANPTETTQLPPHQ